MTLLTSLSILSSNEPSTKIDIFCLPFISFIALNEEFLILSQNVVKVTSHLDCYLKSSHGNGGHFQSTAVKKYLSHISEVQKKTGHCLTFWLMTIFSPQVLFQYPSCKMHTSVMVTWIFFLNGFFRAAWKLEFYSLSHQNECPLKMSLEEAIEANMWSEMDTFPH